MKSKRSELQGKIKLMLVAGARPNFMKIAPIIRAIEKSKDSFDYQLVHTGQHYDEKMSGVFFRGLGIPEPDHNLNVGSGTHAQQTAAIMMAFEPVLQAYNPDYVLVVGDVNSTLACSIVAKKLGTKVAHVEAGLRSGDMNMPEEINRLVTDSISDQFFVTEESGMEHLRREGKSESAIHHVGHVMIDNLLYEVAKLDKRGYQSIPLLDQLPSNAQYGVVTLHRPSNVDDQKVLARILEALISISKRIPLIFPIHPRTRANLEQFQLAIPPEIVLTEPLQYDEFLQVWRGATIVLTDSGGLQEETTALGVPCLTLRENTERPITVAEGSNKIVGTDPEVIVRAALAIIDGPPVRVRKRPKLWDGKSSERILHLLSESL